MQVRETMTDSVEYIPEDATLRDAAEFMLELECGFLPVARIQEQMLKGVITDRDITVRAVSMGLNPETTSVHELMTKNVLYCYEQDDVEHVAENMRNHGIERLIVLNNEKEKKLSGIISFGDIARWHDKQLVGHLAKGLKHDGYDFSHS